MSTKTIAVDVRVYQRLEALKREGESSSRLLDRLLREVGDAHTGADILTRLAAFEPLSPEDAERFLHVVDEDREAETWDPHDLR